MSETPPMSSDPFATLGVASNAGAGTPPIARAAPAPGFSLPGAAGWGCPACGNSFGSGIACQCCGQLGMLPPGVKVASIGRRFGSYLLGALLSIVTLGIGYVIWDLVLWTDGRTPAMQLLGMRAIVPAQRANARWGQMFVRNFLIYGLLFSVLGGFTFGLASLVGALIIFAGGLNQTAWDRMTGIVIVHDPQGLLAPRV